MLDNYCEKIKNKVNSKQINMNKGKVNTKKLSNPLLK